MTIIILCLNRELERMIHSLTPSLSSAGLCNIDIVALDPAPDKLALYHQLRDAYNWTDKVILYI